MKYVGIQMLGCLLTGILLGSGSSLADTQGDKYFQFTDLVNIIERNKINTIEDLLPKLPEDFRENHTLVHHSRSLQEASPGNPRVIMFGEDAGLVIAFNGHVTQKGFQSLETVSFNDETKRFEFRNILFENPKPPKISEINPVRCLKCHGAIPRPIWDEYADWSGVYGKTDDDISSLDGKQLDGRREAEWFALFKEGAKTNPRYQFLGYDKPEHTGSWPYYSSQQKVDLRTINFMPNTRLTILLTVRNAVQTYQIIKANKEYTKYRWILLAVYNSCKIDFTKQQIESFVENYFSDLRKYQMIPDPHLVGSSAEALVRKIQPLYSWSDAWFLTKNIFELLGTDYHKNYSLSFTEPDYKHDVSYHFRSGLGESLGYVSFQIVEDLLKENLAYGEGMFISPLDSVYDPSKNLFVGRERYLKILDSLPSIPGFSEEACATIKNSILKLF